MFFHLLPEDFQRFVLRSWVLAEHQRDGRDWLKLLSCMDTACCSRSARCHFLNTLSRCSASWPMAAAAWETAVTVSDLACFGKWAMDRKLALKALYLSNTSLISCSQGGGMVLPSVDTVAWTSFSSSSLLVLHEICPNITSIESNSLDRAALSEEVLQALRWQVKRFVSMDRLRPRDPLQGMLQSFGPTLIELRFDHKCSYTLSEDELIAVAAHCPHLKVLETKLPLQQQQDDSIAFNQCCCAHIDGLPIISFLLSRLRECEELVFGLQCSSITDLWSSTASHPHLQPAADDDRCRLKRIAFPDWRPSAGTEDSCQRMFIALIAAFPQLQYVHLGDDFRWDLLQQEMSLLELSPPDEEDVWDALLSKCKGITSLRICTPWETPVTGLSLQQQVPVLPLLQQMGAKLLALHLRGIVAISAVLDFLPHCPALEVLSIDFIGVQEGSFLETIASCCRLRQLHVLKEKRVHVTDDLMVALFAGCPQLKDLLIIGAPQLSYAALQGIVDCRLLLHKISLGPRVNISKDDVVRFRELARTAQLLPVPVVEFVK